MKYDAEGKIGLDDIKHAIYNHVASEECYKMINDCGNMGGIECAIAIDKLKDKCKALVGKNFVERLAPNWTNGW